MRSSLVIVPLALSACVEGDVGLFGCPADEVCSPQAPAGLGFFGADLAGDLSLQPVPTVIGGTQSITLRKKIGDTFVDLTSFYTAHGGSSIAVEATEGPVVTIRGTGLTTGTSKLEIRDIDDQLLDRKSYSAYPLGRIAAVPEHVEGTQLPIAFLAGQVRIGVGLFSPVDVNGGETRLADESMQIDAPGSTRIAFDLFELADVPPGPLAFTVTAGERDPEIVEAEVVAAVEELVDHPGEEGFTAGGTGFACFDAVANAHHVSGLTWSITSNNGEVATFLSANCVIVAPATEGSITLTAQAGGLTKEVTYPVGPNPNRSHRAMPRSTPEGERAADALVTTGAASRSR